MIYWLLAFHFSAVLAIYIALREKLSSSGFVGGILEVELSCVVAGCVHVVAIFLFYPVLKGIRDPLYTSFLIGLIGLFAYMLVMHVRYKMSLSELLLAAVLNVVFSAVLLFFLSSGILFKSLQEDTWRRMEESERERRRRDDPDYLREWYKEHQQE